MPSKKSASKPVEGDTPIEVEATKAKPAAPKASGLRTHEAWALGKGLLPQFTIVKGQAPGLSNKRENKQHWKYAAAKGLRAWVVGKEVTETEFDKAVIEACGIAIR